MNSTSQTLDGSVATTAAVNRPCQTDAALQVWLVDDDDRFRTLVADALSRGHGIDCARQFDSPDALLSELASKVGPDVILLDVQMGDQNGLDAVRPIKSLTRSTRVLMFTTCYDSQSRERALDEGASDYLLKTEPLQKLIESIHRPAESPNLLRRRRKPVGVYPPGNNQIKRPSAKTGGASPRALVRALQRLRALWN